MLADNGEQRVQLPKKRQRFFYVVVIDVADRDPDDIRTVFRQSRRHRRQRFSCEHQVKQGDAMSRPRGSIRHQTGAEGKHRHGRSVPIRRNQ